MENLRKLGRGLLRRCPNCGEKHLFRRWLHMKDRCPRCGIFFERVEGYWTGSMALNIILTEAVFAALIITVMVMTWPDPPLVPLLIASIIVNATMPFVLYPITKTLWVAIDLIIHPLELDELAEVSELQRMKERAVDEDHSVPPTLTDQDQSR